MNLKSLFIRMAENIEIESAKPRMSDYLLDSKKKRKSRVKIREHIEFMKYLDGLRQEQT